MLFFYLFAIDANLCDLLHPLANDDTAQTLAQRQAGRGGPWFDRVGG